MWNIHRLLQAQRFPNCRALAHEFEVSRRTIKRDVEYMRERMNLPIAYDGDRGGYCYTAPVENFPDVDVTQREMFSLMIAYKAATQMQAAPFQEPLDRAVEKLAAQQGEQEFVRADLDRLISFRPFGPENSNAEALDLLTSATKNRTAVEFTYRKVGGAEATRRRVHPYHVTCIDGQWYLLAFDTARRAMRSFVVSRMRDAQTLDEKFIKPADFNPEEYLSGSFGAFSGTEDYHIVIEFDAFAADLIRGRKWHATQVITNLRDGGIRFEMRLNSIKEVERWVLSWGTHAFVQKPAALCNRVHEVCAEMAQRYLEQLKEEAARPV